MAFFLFSAGVYAADFESSAQSSVMVELFTSEGCSSCPPAENYLNKLKSDERLWKTLFPMAFHVDYWDYLGWKDRFSSKEYSLRQKYYAHYYDHNTVFTPAYFINGESWRPGFYNKSLPLSLISTDDILKLSLNNGSLDAHFSVESIINQSYVLHTAVLGMGLTNQITKGENAGRLAEHEFVVLAYQATVARKPEWHILLPVIKFQGESQRALVAWVTSDDNPRPLQVAGGLLENNVQHGQ